MPSICVEIQVSCGGQEEADVIAGELVGRRLAACVQQMPIRSTYRWRGAVEHDEEILLLVKTTRARYDEVEALVRDLHSYEVPAITCVELMAGSADYLAWIETETAAG